MGLSRDRSGRCDTNASNTPRAVTGEATISRDGRPPFTYDLPQGSPVILRRVMSIES